MALKPLYANQLPLMFDSLDATISSWKGGEVAGLAYISISGSDKAANDETDGYTSQTSLTRAVATKALVSGMRPLMLVDDGTAQGSNGGGYGTYFGVVIGGTAGQVVSGPAIGPNSVVGSGKVTCFANPGYFAVTLDAVDTTASTGLTYTNTTLAGGAALYATTDGLLTPNAGAAFESVVVGRFVEFSTNGSKVTTSAETVGSVKPLVQAHFHFNPEV